MSGMSTSGHAGAGSADGKGPCVTCHMTSAEAHAFEVVEETNGVITGIASVLALTIPVLGFNPIKGQLLTQVFNVFVLPLVVAGMIVVINRRDLMGKYRAGYLLNALLGLALLFSVLISYNGVLAIWDQLT